MTTEEGKEVAVEDSVNGCVGVLVLALVVSSTLLMHARAGGQG
jgi:hypothetical protein